ncbi:alginate export family protein [Teredinibacter purpureus]|uniref:alginate export family protein n=1 Tax=Teredinibacter purpureus TaxID=2731756 RepID=UPI0005F7D5A1|nr:alginate export family protein [Teredinibacter purpureus]
MKTSLKLFASTAIAVVVSTPAFASESALETLINESTTKVDFRYRYEGVSQDGIAEDAAANTLRSRLTFKSGTVNDFSFTLEMDDARPLSAENYNTATNGNTAYPVVADPKGTDLNQAYVQYNRGGFTALGGRQRILLDDQRFVGGVGWRQNEQTYDGLTFKYDAGDFKGSYSYVNNVNRIFGPLGSANQAADWNGDVHLVNGAYSLSDKQKVVGFVYSLDFENAAGASSDTIGIRYTGDFDVAKLTASYATQSDAGDNPTAYTTDYYLADLSGKIASKISWNVGVEVLGSDDGNKAFTTPLATLHKWQGWADKFLVTPAGGIEDIYVGVGGKAGRVKLKAVYHTFSNVHTGDDLGSEFDAVAVYPINKKVKAVLKYANYSADTHLSDTSKVWFMVQMSL